MVSKSNGTDKSQTRGKHKNRIGLGVEQNQYPYFRRYR